jgi:hypothetical protein
LLLPSDGGKHFSGVHGLQHFQQSVCCHHFTWISLRSIRLYAKNRSSPIHKTNPMEPEIAWNIARIA